MYTLLSIFVGLLTGYVKLKALYGRLLDRSRSFNYLPQIFPRVLLLYAADLRTVPLHIELGAQSPRHHTGSPLHFAAHSTP